MTEAVSITEVGLRDGLQNQSIPVATADKLRLFEMLQKAGLRSFEVTSFVSPRAVPQLADAALLMAGLPAAADTRCMVLVPNEKGYERAVAAGATAIAVVLSATETLNRKNINRSLSQSRAEFREVIQQARRNGHFVRAYVAAAFACPYEGRTPLRRVIELAEELRQAGADEIAVADTIGAGNPAQAREIFGALGPAIGTDALAAHFHDTRGMGLAMAWAALDTGVRKFDGSFGGLGGCPFAPGAAGNLATEDLVFMLEEARFETGVRWRDLFEAIDLAERLLDRPLGGRIAAWHRGAAGGRADQRRQ